MSDPKGFWSTLPGVITKIAGLIGALTGLIVALNSMIDVLNPTTDKSGSQEKASVSAPPNYSEQNKSVASNPKVQTPVGSLPNIKFVLTNELELLLQDGVFSSIAECERRKSEYGGSGRYFCQKPPQITYCYGSMLSSEYRLDRCFYTLDECEKQRDVRKRSFGDIIFDKSCSALSIQSALSQPFHSLRI